VADFAGNGGGMRPRSGTGHFRWPRGTLPNTAVRGPAKGLAEPL